MDKENSNHHRDKLILQDRIQRTYIRIQYDRTVSRMGNEELEVSLRQLENKFTFLFPEA